jgi:hypothetical protein
VARRAASIACALTARSAPLPASRYVACIPISWAARTCAAMCWTSSAGSGSVPVTCSTELSRPPSISRYAVLTATTCGCRSKNDTARTCSSTRYRGLRP